MKLDNSILNTVKNILAIDSSYTHFDLELVPLINGALMTANQLGIGTLRPINIVDKDTKWSEILGGDTYLSLLAPYIAYKVRLLFDPPQNSFLVTALQKEVSEMEWRLVMQNEEVNKHGE